MLIYAVGPILPTIVLFRREYLEKLSNSLSNCRFFISYFAHTILVSAALKFIVYFIELPYSIICSTLNDSIKCLCSSRIISVNLII